MRTRVYTRLLKTDARFCKLDEILGDEVSVAKTLAVWDWFERCLDAKEAHEEVAATDAAEPLVLPPADFPIEGWDG